MNDSNLFWMIMGALTVLIAISATIWAKDLNMKMTWLRWILAILWYLLLMLTVASPLTLLGENEAMAAVRIIPFLLVPTIIIGVALWRFFKSEPRTRS